MINKYIEWITNTDSSGVPIKRDDRALPMLLGTKREQRRWWLSNRYIYMNSKYGIIKNDDLISLGLSVGTFNLPVSVSGDCYVMLKVGAEDAYPIRKRASNTETINLIRVESSGMAVADRVESSLSPASRIRSIENLSVLKLKNADFSKAINLQALRIGSPIDSEKNDSFTALTLSSNPVLRLLDIRNCTNYVNDLTVSGCLNLEKIYVSKTQISNINLPEGGVLKTVQYPSTIKTIKIINQPYLENLIIGSSLPENEFIEKDEIAGISIFDPTENDYSNIEALYLDNVGLINGRENAVDSVEIVKAMPSNGYVYLDNISWEMTVLEFKEIFDKLKDMNGFENGARSTTVKATLGGTLYLHGDFSDDFSLNDIGSRFGDKLKVISIDEEGNEHPFYTVTFYGLNNELIKEATQYVSEGKTASNPEPTPAIIKPENRRYFNIEYINNYNVLTIPGWQVGDATRWDFSGWDVDLGLPITENTVVRAQRIMQYRMNFIVQTANIGETITKFDYFSEGDYISDSNIIVEPYERNYYRYSKQHWTLESTPLGDSYPEDSRPEVSGNERIKTNNASGIQTWYAVYNKSPQTYYIRLYNTDINGNKTPIQEVDSSTGELKDVVFERAVISTSNSQGLSTRILRSALSPYEPNKDNQIGMIGGPEEDLTKDDADREYRFLNWKPYVPTGTIGLQVTGNMDLCLTYYNVNDYYNNYFLNKLVDCNLGNTIEELPKAAFFHNSNLEKLRTYASTIGEYSFANFNNRKRQIFIFDAANVTFGQYCFYQIQNAIIIFLGTGAFTVNDNSFNNMYDCSILMPNTTIPIITEGYQNLSFSGFQGNRNKLFVKDINSYPQSSSSTFSYKVPFNLIASERAAISQINDSNTTYHALMQEAGLE